MSTNHAIKTLMQRYLVLNGYPAEDVDFSLSCCQGDGASFTGELDVKRLASRLVPDVSSTVWDGLVLPEKLEITRDSGLRYVHERSTTLSIDPAYVELTPSDEFGGIAQKVALHRLVTALDHDVVATGAELAQRGYKLLDAYVSEKKKLRTFQTASFRVDVFKCPDDFDVFETEEELEYLDQSIQQIMDGEIECFSLKVTVTMLDDDGDDIAELAEFDIYGFRRDPSIKGLCTDTRVVVREAIAEARDTYLKLMKPRLRLAA
jgi:hypothetical protein